jgi:hypothetical protein
MNSKQNTTKKIWLAPVLMNLEVHEIESGTIAAPPIFESIHQSPSNHFGS